MRWCFFVAGGMMLVALISALLGCQGETGEPWSDVVAARRGKDWVFVRSVALPGGLASVRTRVLPDGAVEASLVQTPVCGAMGVVPSPGPDEQPQLTWIGDTYAITTNENGIAEIAHLHNGRVMSTVTAIGRDLYEVSICDSDTGAPIYTAKLDGAENASIRYWDSATKSWREGLLDFHITADVCDLAKLEMQRCSSYVSTINEALSHWEGP